MLHKRGTMSMVGLPPGDFGLPIFDVVLNAKTVRGSIVGTRKDLQEALAFAGEGKVRTVCSVDKLDNINQVLGRLREGKIEGRVVLRLTDEFLSPARARGGLPAHGRGPPACPARYSIVMSKCSTSSRVPSLE